MAQIINTNIQSLNAQRNLNSSQSTLSTSLQRLSSGLRINSAKDDAAGLAIASRFTSQIRGLGQAVRNANDGVSLAQTAEGALVETTNGLQRIRELALQSSNATNSASDRSAIQAEVNQLKQEIDRIASTTQFNGIKLLTGAFTAQAFQVGANSNQTISVSIAGAQTSQLANNVLNADSGVGTANVGTSSNSAAAVDLASTTHAVTGQTLTVSGTLGSSPVTVNPGDSAFAIAASVNAVESSTGVTAKAYNTASMNALSANGTVSFSLGSGGSTATISASVTTTDLSNLVTEINKSTGTSGISASSIAGVLTLTQSDGKDIRIENFNHGTAGATMALRNSNSANTATDSITLTQGAADSAISTGYVKFQSNTSFSVTSSLAEAGGSIFDAGANITQASAQALVSAVDVSTVAGANSAIDVIDAALKTVNSIVGDLGAIQNRFSATISNLQTTTENLAASRSRIQDADFAQETANLTRSQILQQAGIAMLAQANALPNQVLTLLRG